MYACTRQNTHDTHTVHYNMPFDKWIVEREIRQLWVSFLRMLSTYYFNAQELILRLIVITTRDECRSYSVYAV